MFELTSYVGLLLAAFGAASYIRNFFSLSALRLRVAIEPVGSSKVRLQLQVRALAR